MALVGRRGLVGLIDAWPKTRREATPAVVTERGV
jgi:hypothetical protein